MDIQNTYANWKFGDIFEEDGAVNALDLYAKGEAYEANLTDRGLFMRFILSGDARHLYNQVNANILNWNQTLHPFNERYFSEDKQQETQGDSERFA